jgi:hypothetical protein
MTLRNPASLDDIIAARQAAVELGLVEDSGERRLDLDK